MKLDFNDYYTDFVDHVTSLGFVSKMVDRTFYFPSYHNSNDSVTVPVRVFIHPVTGREVMAHELFKSYIRITIKKCFFQPDVQSIESVFNEIQE